MARLPKPPKNTDVNFELVPDGAGGIRKVPALSAPPRSNKGGSFKWEFANRVGSDVAIHLTDFTVNGKPSDSVKIVSANPFTAHADGIGLAKGVVTHTEQQPMLVQYVVVLNGVPNDPDLIIEGDGAAPANKAKKTAGRKKSRPKKSSPKKRAGKKR